MKEAMMRRFITVSAILLGILGASGRATAQEIQLTGPLAGAPAVRQLRLHRAGRFEVTPSISFTLLDEYQRNILAGARLSYNLTEWLGIGVWGAYGVVHSPTGLSDHIQEVTQARRATEMPGSINNLLTAASIGPNFKDQLGTLSWVVSPQVTFTPFRGKLAIFQKIFVDTDAYFFAGPAFVGLKERADCTECAGNFATSTRMQVTATGGFGLSFYMGGWTSLGLEYRALPFAWNTGGFDTRGGAPDGRFPDNKITKDDRQFKLTSLVSVNFTVYLPTGLKSSP